MSSRTIKHACHFCGIENGNLKTYDVRTSSGRVCVKRIHPKCLSEAQVKYPSSRYECRRRNP